MLRHSWKLCGILLALCIIPTAANAGGPLDYNDFKARVIEVRDTMLGHCRRRGLLNFSGINGSIDEPNSFRRACGQALDGQPAPYDEWTFFFDYAGDESGAWDVFGLQQQIPMPEGDRASLVIAWETRQSFPHQAQPVISGAPIAVLFREGEDGTWTPVWVYTDARSNGRWNPPMDYSPNAPYWSHWSRTSVDRVWVNDVNKGLAKFVFQMHDSRGTGFP